MKNRGCRTYQYDSPGNLTGYSNMTMMEWNGKWQHQYDLKGEEYDDAEMGTGYQSSKRKLLGKSGSAAF